MSELHQSLEMEDSSPFAFLKRPSLGSPLGSYSLIVGYGFMEHGFAKLSRGPEAFAAILHAVGVPAPHLMAWLTLVVLLPC